MYTLLNYYESDIETVSSSEMESTNAEDLFHEIIDFINDGHAYTISQHIKSTEMHIDLDKLSEWMQHSSGSIHVATETYTNQWDDLHFVLILTINVGDFV